MENNRVVNDPEKYTVLLFTGALNDDMMTVLKDGWKYTRHNGAKVMVEYYTYANEWGNHKHTRFFKTVENAVKWYKKEFEDRVILQGKDWLYNYYWEEKGIDQRPDYEKTIETYNIDDAIREWEENIAYWEI